MRACASCQPGAKIVGISVLADRSMGRVNKEKLGVPAYRYLIKIEAQSYEPMTECPSCKKKVPINREFGHWEKFLERFPEAKEWGHKPDA
jgi:hypothetical protein